MDSAFIIVIIFGCLFCAFAIDESKPTSHFNQPSLTHGIDDGSIKFKPFIPCPVPITQGILRNTPAGLFSYYPIGDKLAIGQMVENLGLIGNERNIQRALNGGCPRITSFAIDDGISSNNTGFGQWVQRICLFTDPVYYYKTCYFPQLDTKYNFDMSITLQLDVNSGNSINSYRVSTRCFQNVAYSWVVVASTATIPLNFMKQIREHVTSLGFDWSDARTINYDHCNTCN